MADEEDGREGPRDGLGGRALDGPAEGPRMGPGQRSGKASI